jgi:hypothetical protein
MTVALAVAAASALAPFAALLVAFALSDNGRTEEEPLPTPLTRLDRDQSQPMAA